MSRSKILMGILSAHHPSRWWYRAGARQTYLRNSPLDHVFVFGRPGYIEEADKYKDCLMVDCDDHKECMYYKDQALCRYALDRGYNFCFRACDDTLLFPERILKAGLESYDYGGQIPCKFSLGGAFKVWMHGGFDYMHGGTGIWLSRKAMQMIADDRLESIECDMPAKVDVGMGIMMKGHSVWWDDLRIGEVLKGNLPWDSPLRSNPLDAYMRNGIVVFEDSDLFLNPDPERPLAVHDPGVHKPNSDEWDAVIEQIKQRNVAIAMAARAQEVASAH
jgi:hypothetical protein